MLVSILIPCYNAERWVAEALDSALAQTWAEKEVIVVDDGSTDNSLKVIKSFGDRIRWESAPNRGANAARNRLLRLARGDWLQYLDADDYLLPVKVAKQMEFLALHPQTDVVFGAVTLEHWTESEARRELLPIPEPHDPWVLFARWYLPQTGSSLWRKQAILDVGGWKEDQPCCQEHELYLRLLMGRKRFTYCAYNGAVYRQWSNQTLCTADIEKVHRQRLEIEQSAEDFLRRRSELSAERLWAINQARFETARIAWIYDPHFAREIIAAVRCSMPKFMPGGDAAPSRYRLLYRALGFQATEWIAHWKRTFFAQ